MRCTRRNPAAELPDLAADLLARLRARSPRVHCITNAVAQNFTANVLLAAGAIPSMTIVGRTRSRAFVARADALLVNLGTLRCRAPRGDGDRDRCSDQRRSVPWVLDPVFVDRSPPRADYRPDAGRQKAPAAVRLNAAEFDALARRRRRWRRAARAMPRAPLLGADRRGRPRHRRRATYAHPQRSPADGAGHRHGMRRRRR